MAFEIGLRVICCWHCHISEAMYIVQPLLLSLKPRKIEDGFRKLHPVVINTLLLNHHCTNLRQMQAPVGNE